MAKMFSMQQRNGSYLILNHFKVAIDTSEIKCYEIKNHFVVLHIPMMVQLNTSQFPEEFIEKYVRKTDTYDFETVEQLPFAN